jgi:hypothetical protein
VGGGGVLDEDSKLEEQCLAMECELRALVHASACASHSAQASRRAAERSQRATAEMHRLSALRQGAGETTTALEAAVRASQAAMLQAERSAALARSAAEEAEERLRVHRSGLRSLEGELRERSARLASCGAQASSDRRAGAVRQLRASLSGDGGSAASRVHGFLCERLRVAPAHIRCVNAVLGGATRSTVLVDDKPTALALIRYFTERKVGTVTCQLLDQADKEAAAAAPPSTSSALVAAAAAVASAAAAPTSVASGRAARAVLGTDGAAAVWLSDVIECETRYRPVVQQLTKGWILVADAQAALAVHARHAHQTDDQTNGGRSDGAGGTNGGRADGAGGRSGGGGRAGGMNSVGRGGGLGDGGEGGGGSGAGLGGSGVSRGRSTIGGGGRGAGASSLNIVTLQGELFRASGEVQQARAPSATDAYAIGATLATLTSGGGFDGGWAAAAWAAAAAAAAAFTRG